MKAVMVEVPPELLAERRRVGADQWDEVWNGVLHMVPSPAVDHQDLEGALEHWLRSRWRAGRVLHQINVARPGIADWRDDYRIPDLVLLTPARSGIDRNAYFEGGPDAVVEIRSPEDETYEKIPFYAEVGVRELWVIDRDTRTIELHELRATGSTIRAAHADGWVRSDLGVELRTEPDHRLALRLCDDDASLGRVP